MQGKAEPDPLNLLTGRSDILHQNPGFYRKTLCESIPSFWEQWQWTKKLRDLSVSGKGWSLKVKLRVQGPALSLLAPDIILDLKNSTGYPLCTHRNGWLITAFFNVGFFREIRLQSRDRECHLLPRNVQGWAQETFFVESGNHMLLIYAHFESPWKEFIILEKKMSTEKGKSNENLVISAIQRQGVWTSHQLFLLADPCVCWLL